MTKCHIENNHINWFESKSITGKYELSKQYASICQQHIEQKKWVLFINPDEASLEQLASVHGVDISKVLCVNVKNKHYAANQEETKNLNIEQIKSVLCRGNCSAVILSNAFFKQEEIVELNSCAKQGETQCLVLKTALQTSASIKLH
jgi:cell division inhibitor SulA